ncbi:adipoR/Haemolysin-III-related protein, partial [Kipferlia bialata]
FGWGPVMLLVGGGVAYVVGVVFFTLERPVLVPGKLAGHELFHILILVGAFMHYLILWKYILPYDGPKITE